MNYPIIKVDAFKVSGITVRTSNQDEQNPSTAQIGQLWKDFFGRDLINSVEHRILNTPIYGVYANYESDHHGMFDLTAGVKVSEADPEFDTIEITGGQYMVFDTEGSMPDRIIRGWQEVWAYFDQKDLPCTRTYTGDFEQYVDDTDIKIFIAVQPKND